MSRNTFWGSSISANTAFILFVFLLFVIYRGLPLSLYLVGSISALILATRIDEDSVFAEPLVLVSLSATIGFAILVAFKAWFLPYSSDDHDLSVFSGSIDDLRHAQLWAIRLQEQLGSIGRYSEVAAPIVLIALVGIDCICRQSPWIARTLWATRLLKIALCSSAIVASTSLFSSEDLLGRIADEQRGAIERRLEFMTPERNRRLLETIRYKAAAEALRSLTTTDVAPLARLLAATNNLPNSTNTTRVFLLQNAIERITTVRIASDFESAPQPRASHPQSEEDVVPRLDFVSIIDRWTRVDDIVTTANVDAHSEYTQQQNEAVGEIIGAAGTALSEPIIELARSMLNSMLDLKSISVSDDAAEAIFGAIADEGFSISTKPIVDRMARLLLKKVDRFVTTVRSLRRSEEMLELEIVYQMETYDKAVKAAKDNASSAAKLLEPVPQWQKESKRLLDALDRLRLMNLPSVLDFEKGRVTRAELSDQRDEIDKALTKAKRYLNNVNDSIAKAQFIHKRLGAIETKDYEGRRAEKEEATTTLDLIESQRNLVREQMKIADHVLNAGNKMLEIKGSTGSNRPDTKPTKANRPIRAVR